MRLIKFIKEESTTSYQQIAIIAMVSGIANGLLLVIVNHAAQAVADNEDLAQYFLLYMATFALFLYGQWFAFERAIITIEEAIYNIRIRLTGKIQQVELALIEKMGGNNLYARLTQSDVLISQAIPQITGATQMSILMIFSFLYLAYISPISFIISMITIAIGVYLFLTHSKFIKNSLQNVRQQEADYFKSISHLVDGFKEIKINKRKGNDILKRIAETSGETKRIKAEVGRQESRVWGFGRVFIYTLLPILVFIIPNFSEEHAADIFKISSTMLFITGPVTVLVNVLPLLNRVNMAIGDLVNLEEEMDRAISKESNNIDETLPAFQEIQIDNVRFTYPDDGADFSAGPFDERVTAGELLFIIGGNGSGKSTFLKLLTGLYYPIDGNIYVDSKLIDKSDYTAYRNLFSAIFTDFHLFDKFYGVEGVDEERVNYWVAKMKMQHKVKYHEGGFTSTNLSTGQRKRLAFIAAMLEDKPILVLDEFAADQDPQFRKYFYETLLAEVISMGKTIIAVTHDDYYFHVASRVLKMEEGKFVAYTTTSL